MDVSRYRSPPAAPARIGSAFVFLRPLPKSAIDRAIQKAAIPWRVRNLEPDADLGEAAKQLAIVEAATGEELGRWVSWSEIGRLFEKWVRVQDGSMPDVARLGAELELRVADGEGDGVSDVVSAAACESPQSFYGRPVVDLTEGQIAYYLTCRAVHGRVYGGDRKTCVSRKALMKRAGRSVGSKRRRVA